MSRSVLADCAEGANEGVTDDLLLIIIIIYFFVSLLLNGKYSTLTHCECYLIFLFCSDFFSVYLFFLVLIIIIIIMIISSSRIRIRIIIDIIYTELFPLFQLTILEFSIVYNLR